MIGGESNKIFTSQCYLELSLGVQQLDASEEFIFGLDFQSLCCSIFEEGFFLRTSPVSAEPIEKMLALL